MSTLTTIINLIPSLTICLLHFKDTFFNFIFNIHLIWDISRTVYLDTWYLHFQDFNDFSFFIEKEEALSNTYSWYNDNYVHTMTVDTFWRYYHHGFYSHVLLRTALPEDLWSYHNQLCLQGELWTRFLLSDPYLCYVYSQTGDVEVVLEEARSRGIIHLNRRDKVFDRDLHHMIRQIMAGTLNFDE